MSSIYIYLLIIVLLIVWWVYADRTERKRYRHRCEGLETIPSSRDEYLYSMTNPKEIDDYTQDYKSYGETGLNEKVTVPVTYVLRDENQDNIDKMDYSNMNNLEQTDIESVIDNLFPFSGADNEYEESVSDFNGVTKATFNKQEGMMAEMHVKNPPRAIANPSGLMTRMALDGYSDRKTM